MYILTIIILSFSLISCSKNSPKDPWQGIEDPKFISRSYTGNNKFDLSSVLDFEKVSSDVEITLQASCTDQNDNIFSRETQFFADEFSNSLPLYKIVPKTVALKPEVFSFCNFIILEKNSLGSSNKTSLNNIDVNDFFSISNELHIIGRNIDSNRTDELIEHQFINDYKIEVSSSIGRIKNPEIICDKSNFQTRELNIEANSILLSDFSFNVNQEFPLQSCRFFARGDNNQVLLSKRFRLKTATPGVAIQNASYKPSLSERYFYEDSASLDIPLLSFEVVNEFTFPIHYILPLEEDHGFSFFAHFYQYVGHRPRDYVLFQRIAASLKWSASIEAAENGVITIPPGEKLSLDLNLTSSFICLVGDPTNRTIVTGGNMTHPEFGLTFSIPRVHPIFNLARVQNDNGNIDVIDRDLVRKVFNQEQALSTPNIIAEDQDNMIEDFYYRQTDFYNQKTYSNIMAIFGNAPKENGHKVIDLEEDYPFNILRVCAYL